ncbi:MAG: hypothetical protein E6G92_05650 [Alphaproteobacteria bacterium]|nr:MAG: hypothetical protein E6G92_05650 [Alphaproteobacteria bacterium]
MKKALSLSLCASLLAALPITAAAAQYGSAPPPPPQTPRSNPTPGTPAPAQTPTSPADLLRAAACAAGQSAPQVSALLSTTPRSTEERTQAAALLRTAQRCLSMREQLSTSATGARAAFAEALYEAQFAQQAAVRTPPVGAAPLPRPADAADPMSVALAPMYGLADCATPRHPELARAVLATEPHSPEETAALAALHPDFQACAPAGTPRLSYDPRFMRGFLAEALYRWSVVQRDGPGSP